MIKYTQNVLDVKCEMRGKHTRAYVNLTRDAHMLNVN